jgi:hypothetical protein
MKTKINNHIYTTSIKIGGFGTFFYSIDISLEDVKEIEKFVSYSPANDLPQNPTNEEIENLFPINYSYNKLKNSNKIAVFKSKYTGRCNHTPDRFGNFISHSIIFENNESINIPILFSNFTFRNSLNVEEETNFSEGSTELLYDSSKIDFTFYINYLSINANALNAFLSILDLLINGWLIDGQKNITLLGTKEENQTIIFALYTLLPFSLINKFTFATYVNNPNKYPFQITGMIKESGISRLDSNYFNLIEVDNLSEYNPQNEFTKYFYEMIKSNKFNYDSLLEIINDHNITKFGKSLNFIPKSNEFFENIKSKTIDDYKKILSSDLSTKIKDKIEVESKNQNPPLYIDLLVEKYIKNSIYNQKEFINHLKTFSDKYFSNDSTFRSDYFFDFYNKTREKVNLNNKSQISIEFLIDFDLNHKLDIEQELKIVDTWIVKNEFNNNDLIKLITKYGTYIKKESMLNLFKNKKRIEFENLLNEGKLKSSLLKGNDDFNELDTKDKFDILLNFIWSENEKGKFDITFKSFKELVTKYYDEPLEFWIKFFKAKFEEKLEQKHSLSYLKRNFIINFFNENNIVDFLSRIDLTENEKWWINDYTIENNIVINERVINILSSSKKNWFN